MITFSSVSFSRFQYDPQKYNWDLQDDFRKANKSHGRETKVRKPRNSCSYRWRRSNMGSGVWLTLLRTFQLLLICCLWSKGKLYQSNGIAHAVIRWRNAHLLKWIFALHATGNWWLEWIDVEESRESFAENRTNCWNLKLLWCSLAYSFKVSLS